MISLDFPLSRAGIGGESSGSESTNTGVEGSEILGDLVTRRIREDREAGVRMVISDHLVGEDRFIPRGLEVKALAEMERSLSELSVSDRGTFASGVGGLARLEESMVRRGSWRGRWRGAKRG